MFLVALAASPEVVRTLVVDEVSFNAAVGACERAVRKQAGQKQNAGRFL